jgi:integrase
LPGVPLFVSRRKIMRINTTDKYIPIRKGFPKVYRYQKNGNDYFLVDGRSKTWGLNIRKNFNFKDDALNFAQEIEAQILENGKGVSDNQVYQDKEIERLVTQLKPHGKTLSDAVEFYIHHLEQEITNSAVPPINDLCQKWYDEKRNSKTYPLSEKTKTELKMYWKFITNRLGQFKPNKVSSGMVKKLLEGVGGSETNVTRKQYYRYIRMFFRWCVQEKYIKEDPTDGVRKIRVVPNEIKIYNPDEIERLLRLCESKYPSLLGFYCLTIFGGLRPSEAQKAEWEDIHFETKEIFVKKHGKTGSRRFVLRNADALWVWLAHIKKAFPNEPLNPAQNHIGLQKKVRLEYGNWIQDGLRHSFGTYYHNHTHDIAHVVYVMGNSIEIAKRHYLREVAKEWSDKFWSLKPTT